ncbi:TPA: hypothetical protein ACQ31I_001076 [Yersinia enterocolitica]
MHCTKLAIATKFTLAIFMASTTVFPVSEIKAAGIPVMDATRSAVITDREAQQAAASLHLRRGSFKKSPPGSW